MKARYAALALVAACGGATSSPPARPLGAQAHLAQADRQEADAMSDGSRAARPRAAVSAGTAA